MKNTSHYRVTVNNKDNIVLLDKPLKEAPFFENPRSYCQVENSKTKALIHFGNIRDEYYFRNYKDALRYFTYLQKNNTKKNMIFFNVFY